MFRVVTHSVRHVILHHFCTFLIEVTELSKIYTQQKSKNLLASKIYTLQKQETRIKTMKPEVDKQKFQQDED